MAPRILALAALTAFSCLTAAAQAKAPQPNELAALAATDPELANHFGFFTTRPVTVAEYGGRLVAAANVMSSLMGKRIAPEALNELAHKERLYSENAYGATVALDCAAFARLLTLASGGRYAVSLQARVEGRIPADEAQEAEGSSDLFVLLAWYDHTPMIERSIAWGPDGAMARVSVVNPLSGAGGSLPYKALSLYDPASIDAWEFYRFRKTIR
jgi:hypothetical protein